MNKETWDERFEHLSEEECRRVKEIGDRMVRNRIKRINTCLQMKELVGWTDEQIKLFLGEHDYNLFKKLEESKQSA